MPWLQLKVNSSRDQAEQIEDKLLEAGAVSVTFEQKECALHESES